MWEREAFLQTESANNKHLLLTSPVLRAGSIFSDQHMLSDPGFMAIVTPERKTKPCS
jgi:hypothetical protein